MSDTCTHMLYYVLNLRFDVVKGFPLGYVVNCYTTMRIPQVLTGNCLKTFLTGSVPKLQLYSTVVNFYMFHFKIYSYGTILSIVKNIFSKS